MKKTILALVAIMLLAAPVAADNFLQTAIGFLGNPDGTSVMFCHGRTAQGVGPALNFQLHKRLYADIGLLTSSTTAAVRVVPGLSLCARIRKATGNDILKLLVKSGLELYGGAAWTPTEYGGSRVGLWDMDNVGVYGGLRKTF